MLPLVGIPEFVQHYAPSFSSVFSTAGFEQFQRYVSGLLLSENKTVDGINQVFAIEVRNQSSLNLGCSLCAGFPAPSSRYFRVA